MDRARTCYRVWMDFGDGQGLVEVQWYFVDEGTPFLPFSHNFGMRHIWSQYKPWVPHVPGEQWTGGTTLTDCSRVRAAGIGQWIGTPQQWLQGLPPGTTRIPLLGPGTPAGTLAPVRAHDHRAFSGGFS